jgi:hypothetical protein
LQQAQHAVRALQVGVDLGKRPQLRASQIERKSSQYGFAEFARRRKASTRAFGQSLAYDRQRELVGEQFVVSKP